jgi:predicted small integral membrane protein
MLIPGFLIAIVTFPGVIVHELAHVFFCRWAGVPILEVKYFQLANPCGYVIHDPIDKPFANFMISVGPFIINTIVGLIIIFPGALVYQAFGLSADPARLIPQIISLWLGLSVLAHAFPSTGDAKAMAVSILKNEDVNIFVKILVAPVVGLIYIGSIGSVVWLDFAYAVAVSAVVPRFVLSLF